MIGVHIIYIFHFCADLSSILLFFYFSIFLYINLPLTVLENSINGIPNINKFGSLPIPQTEFQNNLKDLSITPIELWLMDFVTDNGNVAVVEMLAGESYMKFKNWLEQSGTEYNISAQKFGVRLTNLQVNGITKGERTSKGNFYSYNIKNIRTHFKI